jgi:DNA-binding PadR family transcriptional regulator
MDDRIELMVRDKNLPLTETVYYILLALVEPAHGYAVMQKVEELSGGQVRLAAGTLYGAVETLQAKGYIGLIPSTDSRRKVYGLTQAGMHILSADAQRMRHMLKVTEVLTRQGEGQ